jgi:sodium/potassium-transporting ATPase subunit alpha
MADDEKKVDITEHLKTIDELQEIYSVKVDTSKPSGSVGLSKAEVGLRLEKYGLNRLTPPKKKHPLLVYIGYVMGLFNLMLNVAGIAMLIIYGAATGEKDVRLIYIGVILIVVAFLNAFIEFYQVQKSQSILESFLVDHKGLII